MEWISVKDGLPPADEKHPSLSECCLWFYPDGTTHVERYYVSLGPGELATHWMPLPPPPAKD